MCSDLIIILHILILCINQIMYSFTYKISLEMVLIRLFLNEIILIILIKLKLKIMEKKLFAIECGNVALVVRPNGDTVIVTETGELVLDNAVMEQIVRNSGAYKSFVATKDEIVSGLEEDNTNLQIKVRELKKSLKLLKLIEISCKKTLLTRLLEQNLWLKVMLSIRKELIFMILTVVFLLIVAQNVGLLKFKRCYIMAR